MRQIGRADSLENFKKMKDFSTVPLLNLSYIAENYGEAANDPELRDLHIAMWEGVYSIFADIREALAMREEEEEKAKLLGVTVATLPGMEKRENPSSFKKWHSIRGYAGGVGLARIWETTTYLETTMEEPLESVREYTALLLVWAKESLEECEKVFPYLKEANAGMP